MQQFTVWEGVSSLMPCLKIAGRLECYVFWIMVVLREVQGSACGNKSSTGFECLSHSCV